MERTMKPGRRIRRASAMFFALLALLPAVTVLSALCGWRVTLEHEAVGLSLFSASLLFLTVAAGEPGRTGRVFAALLPIMVFFNTLVLLYRNVWIPTALFVIANAVCAWVMFARFAGPDTFRRISVVVAGALHGMLLFILPVWLLGAGFGHVTVVQSIPSPDGRLTAQVIDDDQGSLGGNTIVEVNRGEDLFFLRIEDTQRVYTGRWGEFYDMRLAWQDDDTLLINGKPYDIP